MEASVNASKSAQNRTTKPTKACDSCRIRKTKCDGAQPSCGGCIKHEFSCSYVGPVRRPRAKKRPLEDENAILQPNRKPFLAPLGRPTSQSTSYTPLLARPGSSQHNGDWSEPVPPHEVLPADYASSSETPPTKGNGDNKGHRDSTSSQAASREFHGPSGMLAFLEKLRAKARRSDTKSVIDPEPRANDESNGADSSLANYLQSPDLFESRPASRSASRPAQLARYEISIEKECVRLYFQNLHFMHPVLDKAEFLRRCDEYMWSGNPVPRSFEQRTFVPLYNAVVATGAIIAPEDEQVFQYYGDIGYDGQRKPTKPLVLAAKYFKRTKADLGDIIEMCSVDGTVTMLLLSIYCQNTLRQHSCYMYVGMAVRAAFAMGLPFMASTDSSTAGRLWWALYSFEVEMSVSAGGVSSLQEPSSYAVAMPPIERTSPESFITYMVSFASFLNDTCRHLYNTHPGASMDRDEKSRECLAIDQKLQDWKNGLDSQWSDGRQSLTEPEWRTKQKLVIRLRSLNVRILLHRPFLLFLTASPPQEVDQRHIQYCLEASQSTIATLYDAFLHRPFFRTWYYNTTYLLYATMIVLYVLLSYTGRVDEDSLLQDGQRSLQVLDAMRSNPVAARCAKVIEEVLHVATEVVAQRRRRASPPPQMANAPATATSAGIEDFSTEFQGLDNPDWFQFSDMGDRDLLWNLVDTNFLDGLLDFEPSNLNAFDYPT